jgi:16S rRNA (cytosine967-C5)-methyltransferase
LSDPATRASPVSPARACAFAVVRRVFEQGAYADRALISEAADLDPRERAFATQLAYGTIQRRATLDHVAEQLAGRPPAQLDPPLLAALRLGLFQLLFLDGVADHAAVNESVELAKRTRSGGFRLVNAVLRRAVREAPAILARLGDATPSGAAARHSVPEWLAERWFSELGPDNARALLARANEPAESSIRVNTLTSTRDEVRARLPVSTRVAQHLPEGLVLEGPFDAHASAEFGSGAIMPQSRASMLVARIVDPRPGERMLDLCAAPGGKTTHLAALMQDDGELIAVERHPGRARALERTCKRMHASCVAVEVGDAAAPRPGPDARFDRVLVDPPCSGLGTLQSRPDLRWRVTEDSIAELAAMQAQILAAGAAATALGGVLVYSVCTISRTESHAVIGAFLAGAGAGAFALEDLGSEYPEWRDSREPRCLQLLPDRDLTDGFFIARLRREND